MGVVDPRDRPLRSGEGVDRRELPVDPRSPGGEAQVRPAALQSEQCGQVLIRTILPAGAPDALEVGGQTRQVLTRLSREQVRDPVDHVEPTCRRFGFIEAEKGDHSINVD